MRTSDFFTTLRLILAPIFFLVFCLPDWIGMGSGFSVFVLVPLFIFMEFTDFLDGFFARKKNEVRDFGKVFDPFADVLANLTVLFCFVLTGYMPAFLYVIILYREMGITFVRMIASSKGVAIGARKGGKLKTVLYIIAAAFSLFIESLTRLSIPFDSVASAFSMIGLFLYISAVVASVFSFIDYLVCFSSVLRSDKPE
ncbi:MAG: CDP-diacylglycerol--glycerol-3-phosphate 3-phosphatidyltransferase [Spirochaetes bacterium ADurb.Bin269]|jgi:CDP-diacylglycerol--glycerol-3-phosphate 3-phosphatidyltransferase|nr:MAG: CDP-diacylglycerol--glycerol-3-phosphate 3-phosphatidyltransferase [Spirochaetes bacterium ADurb.Bin269]